MGDKWRDEGQGGGIVESVIDTVLAAAQELFHIWGEMV